MQYFASHSDCKTCPLHETASHPGIPTRAFRDAQGDRKQAALLIVGQSPGYHEDREGTCFVGYTGQLLGMFVTGAGLPDLCDVYLSNAVRCCPPQGATETQSQIRACRPHLQRDIDELRAAGYSRIVGLALGAKASYSLLNITSLNEAMRQQGIESRVFEGMRVFCTYHPAMLHPSRSPGKVKAVEEHFRLLVRHMQEDYIPNQLAVKVELGIRVPDKLPSLVGCDIETYGILAGRDQSVFHPVKSYVVDGVPYAEQVRTICFGWEEGDTIRTAQYVFANRAHRRIIREWVRRMCRDRITCLGQNIKFDLLYLYMSGDPTLRYWIDPTRLRVDDTLLWMFLLYEQQPEKGLKELTALFGLADYSRMRVTGKTGNAKSDYDPDVLHYNSYDVAACLTLRRYLEQRIRERYGDDTPKLGPVCEWMRNATIWDVFELEKNGSTMDLRRVQALHDGEAARCDELLAGASEKYETLLAGPGSDQPLRQLMLDSVHEAGMDNDSRVEWCDKTGKISIGVENVHLLTPNMPEGRNKELLLAFQEYKERSKTVNTYTRPLLYDPRKGIVTRDGGIGVLYPSWYPIPSYAARGGSAEEKSGGQIQGRFSCQKPARQTEPKQIRQCSCSRWPGGTLVECDMSQDHLRMAALMSGDPLLLEIYEKDEESIHVHTAKTIFPGLTSADVKRDHPNEYKLGKTLNFAIIFRCGANTFQQTALHDVGIQLELPFCAEAIMAWSKHFHRYWDWQAEILARVAREGYLTLPTGWSRTFGMGEANVGGQQGEALNFLHQGNCAQMTHSAEYKIIHEYRKRKMRSVLCLNIYDALFVDCYPGEEEEAQEILLRNMNHPPLLPVLEDHYGHSVKWQAELKLWTKPKGD